jgi:hypothetical protein
VENGVRLPAAGRLLRQIEGLWIASERAWILLFYGYGAFCLEFVALRGYRLPDSKNFE